MMRSTLGTRVLWRLMAALAAGLPLLLATASPAAAAAPSNDDITNATVIANMPFHDTVDMSQATWNFSTDSPCFGSQDLHSVWYTFTPVTSEQVAFDPSASLGLIGIDVFTGSPGALSRVGCGSGGLSGGSNGGFILNATGGTKYWVMASTICCAATPNLNLWVYLAVAPQATVTVDGGTVDLGGNATIAGTLDCVGTVPNGVEFVAGNVRQSVGRLSSVVANFNRGGFACAQAVGWTALAQPFAGKFVGGHATVNAQAGVCNIVGCVFAPITAVIKLRG